MWRQAPFVYVERYDLPAYIMYCVGYTWETLALCWLCLYVACSGKYKCIIDFFALPRHRESKLQYTG